jgi:tartrate dehydrogenase/decarboxylase/D-malate dehydrogenase
MMLDFLGEGPAAGVLMAAIEAVTASGCLTADLGGTARTTEFTDRVLERLAG